MSYQRTVSGIEKLMIALNELRPPFVIQLVLEGQGDVTPERLNDALERCTAANPGSSLHFVDNEGQESWQIGPPPTLTLVDEPGLSMRDGEGADFLMWRLDCATGPTCELLRVQTDKATYLVFRALHAVMDGHGTINWVSDFMRCLRGEDPVGHPSTLDVDELMRRIKTAEARPMVMPDAIHPFGLVSDVRDRSFSWRRVSVDRSLDSGIVGRIAVALAERARRIQSGIVRINLPTNIRQYAPEERTTANMFNSFYVEIPEGAAPEAVGMRIIQMLYRHEGKKKTGPLSTDHPGSLAIHRVKVLRDLAHVHRSGRYPFSAGLSHLGVLELADFSAPGFEADALFFVPLVSDSGCSVNINGSGKRTEVTAGLVNGFNDKGQLDQLAALLERAVCGG